MVDVCSDDDTKDETTDSSPDPPRTSGTQPGKWAKPGKKAAKKASKGSRRKAKPGVIKVRAPHPHLRWHGAPGEGVGRSPTTTSWWRRSCWSTSKTSGRS